MTSDDANTPGASAQREYERRKANDEARIHAAWGRFGKIAVALTPEKQTTRAWAVGAEGEERVGARLDQLAGKSIRVLHDRRIPGTRANIDHIVVTPACVWVIDTKRYAGDAPEKRVEGGWIRPRVERLWARGDKTKLVDSVWWQMEKIEEAVGPVPIRGALCFIDASWGMLASPFTVNEVLVTWPRDLAKRIVAGAEGELDVDVVAATLDSRFRAR